MVDGFHGPLVGQLSGNITLGWSMTAAGGPANDDFAKGDDICRVTVIEGSHATHVDYTVARVNRPN